jgi:hypothetical protein
MRDIAGLTEAEKAETAQMEAAGFKWDPSPNGYARWTHAKVDTVALYEPWMRAVDWERRRAQKIAEAGKLRRYDEIAFGTRFRFLRDRRTIWVKIGNRGTHGSPLIVQWQGVDTVTQPNYRLADANADRYDSMIVELYEPFEGLMRPSEVEELPKLVGVWEALADWHDYQSAGAEAADAIESSKWHDEHSKAHRATAVQIKKKWEDGFP